METIIWIFQALLAMLFVGAASMKLTPSVEKMIERKQLPPDGNPIPLRILGVLEFLGSVGIILPQLINVYPVLTPITAVCFCAVLIGAFSVHIKNKESKMLPLIIISFVLSAVVAYYRF